MPTALESPTRKRVRVRVRVDPTRSQHKSSDKWTLFFEWCEATLKVPAGHGLAGKPFHLEGWQRRFIKNATKRYNLLACARKNGKTGMISALLLGYLCGPLNEPGWKAVAVSLTSNHVAELKNQMQGIAWASGLIDSVRFYKTPIPGLVKGLNDSEVAFLSSDKASGHSIGADVILVDELGLMTERDRDLWNALGSCISAKNGRIIAISVRGNCPMLNELYERRHDKSVYFEEFTFDSNVYRYDDEKGWKAANPGLNSIKSLSYMRDRARLCLSNNADISHFLSYDLNLPTEPGREMILTVQQWLELCGEGLPDREGPCFLGVDQGGSSSMTAAVAYWPLSGRLEAWGAFPDSPSLKTRGESDGVGATYERMKDQGFLTLHPGRITNAEQFVRDCAERLAGYRVECFAADRYRKEEAATALRKAKVDWPVQWRGQGHGFHADGSFDVRAFQTEALTGGIKTIRNLTIEHAVAESSIKRDPAGNPKLDRSRSKSRIDALQAAVLAVGMGHRWKAKQSTTERSFYRGVF